MASFTTRVILHDADDDDYLLLHEKMDEEGFSTIIVSDDGTVYELPPAEYNYEGEITRSDVLAKAKAAAAATKRKSGILVTEAKGRSWTGLKQVN